MLCLPRNLHIEGHRMLCLPRNLHIEGHRALGGSGKLVNCSLKEHMLSQGKLLGEASVTATKSFEVLASLCEGVDGLQET